MSKPSKVFSIKKRRKRASTMYKISFLWFKYPMRITYSMNKRYRIPRGQSQMDIPEKPATQESQDKEKQIKNTQHNMC